MCCVSYTHILMSASLMWSQRRDKSWRGELFKNTSSKQEWELKLDISSILSMTVYRKRVSRFPEHCYFTHHPFFFGIRPRIWQSSKFLEMRVHRPNCICCSFTISFFKIYWMMVAITIYVRISMNSLWAETRLFSSEGRDHD